MNAGSAAFEPIGYVMTAYGDPTGVPSQAAANAEATGRVVVAEDLVDALLGIDRYRWIWLLTWLDLVPAGASPLHLVPEAREAEGRVQGVFASRAPARPNPIGLHLVRLVT